MTYTTRVLCVGTATACAAAFLLLWLIGSMSSPSRHR